MTNEETRAATYTATLLARDQARRARLLGLAGDPVVAATLHAAWAPVTRRTRGDAEIIGLPGGPVVTPTSPDRACTT
jgi:hypothetical protein